MAFLRLGWTEIVHCWRSVMEKDKLILGFAGKMGSGKGAATQIVKDAYPGTPSFRFSDALREFYSWLNVFVRDHGLGLPKEVRTKDLQDLSTELRRLFGQDVLERGIMERVRKVDSQSPIVIVDGIRRPSDIDALKKNPRFRLIYIHLDERVRWQRHRARNEKSGDAELSFEQFQSLGDVEAEREIGSLRPLADLLVHNKGGILELPDLFLPQLKQWL